MTDTNQNDAKPMERGGIDPAALVLASLACTGQLLLAEGEFSIYSLILGVTVTSVLYAYDVNPMRNKRQSWAFSLTVGLSMTFALGVIPQMFTKNTTCWIVPLWFTMVWIARQIEGNRNLQSADDTSSN